MLVHVSLCFYSLVAITGPIILRIALSDLHTMVHDASLPYLSSLVVTRTRCPLWPLGRVNVPLRTCILIWRGYSLHLRGYPHVVVVSLHSRHSRVFFRSPALWLSLIAAREKCIRLKRSSATGATHEIFVNVAEKDRACCCKRGSENHFDEMLLS